MLSEDEVLSKIGNKNLIAYYKEFPKLTGLNIKCNLEEGRTRARNEYSDSSEEFRIFLGNRWKEVDLAHELIHGKIMFIAKYGIIRCNNYSCQLIRDYLEDIVVHENILNQFNIQPIHKKELSQTMSLTKGLSQGEKLIDSYWDPKGCGQLHKAFIYVQNWHLYHLLNDVVLKKFLIAFRKTYQQSIEMQLANNIIDSYKKNNKLKNKLDYDTALEEIIGYCDLPVKTSIKHYEKTNGGFVLI
jgi:hypothetical protein